jgi:DNA-directed RNA polymerase specialized sigma24 family protein
MSRNFASDQELIDSLRMNDTEAFEELFRRYWYNLYIYSLKKLRSSDDSRQIVRDIFKELWEKRQSWPANFSLPKHLYAEVRKAVIKSLSQKLNAEYNSPVITEEILPGFSVTSLQEAKLPVMKKHAINKPAGLAKQQTIRRKSHADSTIANMKWLFNVVTARLN